MTAVRAFAFEWVLHVYHATWQGTAAALVLMAVARVRSPWSPSFRAALLGAAALKFVLPPMIPAPTGVFSPFHAELPALLRRGLSPESGFGRVCVGLVFLHAAGMVRGAWRLAREAFALERIRRSARPVDEPKLLRHRRELCSRLGIGPEPPLLASLEVSVPCAFGMRKPAILVPQSPLDRGGEASLRLVLAHELAHLARRDPRRNALRSGLAVLWWFNPAVQALVERLREISEELADDAALEATRGSAREYAQALVSAAAAAGTAPVSPACAISGKSAAGLERRIVRLADPGRRRSSALSRRQRLAVAAVALLFLPGVRPGQERPKGRSLPALSPRSR